MNDDQAPMDFAPLTDENIRVNRLNMAQTITTQTQAATTQDQAMTTQTNREVVPRSNNKIATMTSSLRGFTTMNPPTFYWFMVE